MELGLLLSIGVAAISVGDDGQSASDKASETVTLIRAEQVIVRPGVVELDSGVLISGGRIIAVGKGLEAPQGARELRGKVVCAGFIDAWSCFGLEPETVRDERTNAATFSADGFDAYIDPRIKREVLRAGVTSVRLQAGVAQKVAGLGALVRNHPDPKNQHSVLLHDACLGLSIGITRESRGVDLFERVGDVDRALGAFGDGLSYLQDKVEYKHELDTWQKAITDKQKELDEGFKKAKKDREKEEADAKQKGKEFKEKAYKEDKKPKPPRFDEDKEVLARAVDGAVPVVVEVHRALELRGLLEGTEKYDRLRLIVAGGTEATSVASELSKRHIPVIVVPRPLGDPRPPELENSDAGLASRLHEAGVHVLIGSGGSDPLASRDLPMLASIAIGYGLPRDAAFDALTLGAAMALDIGDRVGSIEVGKDADLIVLDGEPLSLYTRVLYALSNGDIVVTPED